MFPDVCTAELAVYAYDAILMSSLYYIY
jgi:hypothetical protein